jgi:hypothetical protein
MTKLPGVEALNTPGEKNGQTKLVRDKTGVDAYQVFQLLTEFYKHLLKLKNSKKVGY